MGRIETAHNAIGILGESLKSVDSDYIAACGDVNITLESEIGTLNYVPYYYNKHLGHLLECPLRPPSHQGRGGGAY